MTCLQKGTRYFRTDLHRILHKKETYVGMLGVAAALFFSMESSVQMELSVLYVFSHTVIGTGFLLAFLFCALPYGTALSEDMESQYIKYAVIRGNLKKYVFSKTAAAFLSSMLVMGAGCMLFALLCSLKLPWLDVQTYESELLPAGNYLSLISKKWYLLWVGAYGIQQGIWAGCLSAAAQLFSLFVSNKLLVLAVPMLLNQIFNEIGYWTQTRFGTAMLDINVIFDAGFQLFDSTWKVVLYAFGTGVVFCAAVGTASYFRIRQRI